jgi:hypothetical protein
MIDALEDIIDLICDCYEHPVKPEFAKASRAAQIGYQTQRILLDREMIRTGKAQEELKL